MEQIVSLLIYVCIIIIFFPVIIILTKAYKQARQRNKVGKKMIEEYADEESSSKSFPIRYASEARFNKIWKLFPWEDFGILTIRKNDIIFFREKAVELQFPVENTTITWIGTKYWPNGIISWFVMRYNNVNHYFTSDTGMWAIDSHNSTKEIYEFLLEHCATNSTLYNS